MMPSSVSSETYGYPGTLPSISAKRDQQRDLWAVQNTSTNNTSIGVLRAYDATNLAAELYNSATVPADNIQDNKFITPTITNGKVYVGTPDSVAVCFD